MATLIWERTRTTPPPIREEEIVDYADRGFERPGQQYSARRYLQGRRDNESLVPLRNGPRLRMTHDGTRLGCESQERSMVWQASSIDTTRTNEYNYSQQNFDPTSSTKDSDTSLIGLLT